MKTNIFVFLLFFVLISMIQSLIEKKTAIVVGAGPAGLLTSIILQKRGWKTTIIEKSSGIKKDKSKSYQYLLDGRGQTILNHLNLLPPIISESVLSSQVKLFIEYLPSRTIKQSNFSLSFGAEIEKYWIPRDVFLNVLFHFIKELNQQVDDSLKIQLLFNTSCRDISLGITDASDEDNRIRVSCNDDESIVLTADLVVACDGLNSAVRTSLKRLYGDPFDIQTYPCLANLRFKTLSLMDGCINTSSTAFTVIRGTGKTSSNRLNLGILPTKEGLSRTCNLICLPHHDLWKIKTVDEFIVFLNKIFPQLQPLHQYISHQEMERFITTIPGEFPPPQHPKSLMITRGRCGVVLLGDAAHAFPPDLGQGVNSALMDVYVFNECLQNYNDDIPSALKSYEEQRLPEAKALCEIMSFGYPQQYNHMPISKKLALLNFGIRLSLNRLFPNIIFPPAVAVITNPNLSYTTILKRVHATTFRLIGTTLLSMMGFIFFFIFKTRMPFMP